ncbi:hypothetical protein [Chitinilyticum litopenaei]|uniref:hypothetical protein n=1 Tax=Chitinilyticum litopenaei TaxID=1121276 RepID=UPI000490A128|nr:hypothetical protein [Chitinilyticum litopenaei]
MKYNIKDDIETLEEWLKNGHYISENESIKSELSSYAKLPIRKFSNAYAEKSAGYIRTPPLLNRFVSNKATEFTASYLNGNIDTLSDLTAYSFYDLYYSIHRNLSHSRCIHIDAAQALSLLLLCNEENLITKVLPILSSLAKNNLYSDPMGASGLFIVNCFLEQHGSPWIELQETAMTEPHKQLLKQLREPKVDTALRAVYEHHIKQCQIMNSSSGIGDYLDLHARIIPFPLVTFIKIRKTMNLETELPDDLELLKKTTVLLSYNKKLEIDEILASVIARAEKCLPDLLANTEIAIPNTTPT